MARNGSRSLTLRAVAKRAGVSLGAASNVFTGKAGVSAEARSAVETAAVELGYQPRPHAPARAGTTLLLLSQRIQIPVSGNPFYGPVLHGVQQACVASGVELVYAMLGPHVVSADRLPDLVQRRRVQGLLLLSYVCPETLAVVRAAGLPVVLIDHFFDAVDVDSVMGDDEQGGYLATRALLDRGHHRPVPAMITGPPHVSLQRRLAGYRRALAECNLASDERYVIAIATTDPSSGFAAMRRLLELAEPPTAVFCCNDSTALGVLNCLHQRGVAVPDRCSVVSYDDIDLAAHAVPPLTTIAVDKEQLGASAVRYLLERIDHPAMTARYTRLAVRLVERKSLAPVTASHDLVPGT